MVNSRFHKLKIGSKAWKARLKQAVLAECPPLIECRTCGYFVQSGYACACGDSNPGINQVDPIEWL